MTRLFFLTIGLLLCPLSLRAAPPGSTTEFERANKRYEQGNFAEAATIYAKIVQAGDPTPSVWFNLGNAAYKSGQIGKAIAAYRMAERRTPRDAELRANLQFVRTKVYSDERTRVPIWKNSVRLATLNEWTILSVALLWLSFSILVGGELLKKRYTAAATTFFLLFVVSTTSLGTAIRDQTITEAIVIAKEATARFGPLDESQAAFQLRDGAELTVIGSKNLWIQVRDAEKRVGWVRRDAVELVPTALPWRAPI